MHAVNISRKAKVKGIKAIKYLLDMGADINAKDK